MFSLNTWPYIRQPAFTGDCKADLIRLLSENGKADTAAHCIAVANTSIALAKDFYLDIPTAETAALLHDSSAVILPEDMKSYALSINWPLAEAEEKHPFLLHQRISALTAEFVFHIENPEILSAIGCHTTLKANPSAYDMLLFLADKLSWDQPGMPPFTQVIQKALEQSLAAACLAYIRFTFDHNMILMPHPLLLDAKAWLEQAL